MYKIAIVGTSHIKTKEQESDIRDLCTLLLQWKPKQTLVISGGADGVDKIAISVARGLGLETKEYYPEAHTWPGYATRNKRIAENCDEVVCITIPIHTRKCYHHKPPQDHEKTAGCWTLRHAKTLGKNTSFFKV